MTRFRQAALAFTLLLLSLGPAAASVRDDEKLINDSAQAVRDLRQQYQRPVADVLGRARAALVFPSLLQAGFIVGGAGGPGVLCIRQADGSWSNPAFYGYIAGSVGLQVGAKSGEVLIAVMTDAALRRLMQNNFKLGADASIAAGTAGGGAEVGTVGRSADLLVYSKDAGLFAGGALNGASISPSEDRNREFYGPAATPQKILNDPHKDPGSAALRAALAGRPAPPPATAVAPR